MGAAAPAPAPPVAPRRLLFQRDAAGWNNVRICFESYVCVARLTQRQLVLPPPTVIDHLGEHRFHELQVYDAAALGSVVHFASGAAAPAAAFAGSLQDVLRADARGALPLDVVLGAHTRLLHFECLELSRADARVAAEAVLALALAEPYHEAARALTWRAALAEPYHAVHLRRGDFASFRPDTQWSGSDLQGRVRHAFPAAEASWPLLVACVADERDPFPELAAGLPERRVLRADELHISTASALHRVVVDTLLLSGAARFAGTPDSTYSNGVWHWRARERVLRGERPESPRGLAGPLAAPQCWQRCSTFAALLDQ